MRSKWERLSPCLETRFSSLLARLNPVQFNGRADLGEHVGEHAEALVEFLREVLREDAAAQALVRVARSREHRPRAGQRLPMSFILDRLTSVTLNTYI